MTSPVPINELEIIGYATALKETMLPSVVPPVFRFKANPSRAFLPPYAFHGDQLWNAVEVGLPELQSLAEGGEITVFTDGFPAQVGFELWVDPSFQRHYQPRSQAHDALRAIAWDQIKKAEEALQRNAFADAERYCGVALSADDRLVEPLAIRASIQRARRDSAGERMFFRLASGLMTEAGFAKLVAAYDKG
jgi:hypothetical protein